jgi:hypothetical protein
VPQAGSGKAVDDAAAERQAQERESLKRSLIFATVFALPVFLLEMGGTWCPLSPLDCGHHRHAEQLVHPVRADGRGAVGRPGPLL